MSATLLICHRRARSLSAGDFLGPWAEERAALVARHQAALGHPDYHQIRRLSRLSIVYNAVRLSRSWPLTALISLLRGRRPPSLIGNRDERWDLVEQLQWPEPAQREAALASEPGGAALQALAQHADAATRHHALLSTERVDTMPLAPGETAPDAVALFCLRAKPPMEREHMLADWIGRHGPLVASLQGALGYAAYAQLAVRGNDDTPTAFDGVALLAYPGLGTMRLGLIRPRTQLANLRLVWDETAFLDTGRSALIIGRVARRLSGAPPG
ncbi:hypothetical protein [Sediminicurvatus halobius]|uniref:EthD domain-containing protein n=1 Tax=Sediminicurvatus halobius TaxID=2182432 RepID=A0A2U2N4J1_9GAMM|nr:hypothetical protein [Spiribacter halobius]PWG63958.1 hypothetical protein DEM34_07125 [Spiribacter halobius]UEX76374.1 hypothetical protein LMH63_10395 [Spiribacter halobius]